MNDALIAELRQKFPADKPKMLAYLPGDRPIGSPSNLSYLIERVIKALETIPSAIPNTPYERLRKMMTERIEHLKHTHPRDRDDELVGLVDLLADFETQEATNAQ